MLKGLCEFLRIKVKFVLIIKKECIFMKNNNTRELNFNFIERQPIATEAYLLLLFGSTDQENIKEKMLEVYRELYDNDKNL